MEKVKCSICGKIKPLSAFRKRMFKCRVQYAKKRCLVCYLEYRNKVRRPIRQEKRKAKKLLIMKMYGNGKCKCCGEDKLEFLSLDHIGGTKTKIKIGHVKHIKGANMYDVLIKQNFPHKNKLRVLCMNCNWSLGINGYCPHKKHHVERTWKT